MKSAKSAIASSPTSQSLSRTFLVSMSGVLLYCYDTSLFGFMAPILIGLFMPEQTVMTGLIWMLGVNPIVVGLGFAPLGAVCIGKIGDKWGRKKALTIAMTGIGVSSLLIGCLPTFDSIGYTAPILFSLLIGVQRFFAAGEYNGGAIYLLEHVSKSKRPLWSGLYCAVAGLGILLATVMTSIVQWGGDSLWRVPFIVGAVAAFIGFYTRLKAQESPEFQLIKDRGIAKGATFISQIKDHWRVIFCVLGVIGFFKTLYGIPSIFMNAFLPIVSSQINAKVSILLCTGGMIIYMLALPLGGYLAYKYGTARSMKWAIVASGLLSIPMFMLLQDAGIVAALMIKGIFSVLAGWYIGPLHAWLQGLFQVSERYTMISFSYKLGSQTGYLNTAASLWLWHITEQSWAPAIPLLVWAILALTGLGVIKKINS